jgi:D-alanyl-lipoteichoic acid acyltransferase DltB (MBOAT superfamily)
VLFNSLQYAGFLALVLVLYWALRSRQRRWLLLIASYAFYATWDWRFMAVLAATTLVHFELGRRLGRTRSRQQRKVLVATGVLFSLGLLGVFKYFDFFVSSFASLLAVFGIEAGTATLAVAVPVGISFFTLHALSYTIDVYRRDLEPTPSLLSFAVFVAYFPQLLAGPLTRARTMLPQFERPPARPDRVAWRQGAELILVGLFQKVAIADALAPLTGPAFVDTSTGTLPERNWIFLVLAAVAGFCQFVLDFAGYSNMARGTSKLMGIELPYNFREPLTRSRNLQDYWRRHNMTLMSWFRDYVYRPLRPGATTEARAFVLVVLVFVLSGLWHRPTAGWLVWGLLVGLGVAVEGEVNRARARRARARGGSAATRSAARSATATATITAPRRLGRQLRASAYCIGFLSFTIVLVRTPNLSTALDYYAQVLRFEWAPLSLNDVGLVLYAALAVIGADHVERRLERTEHTDDPVTWPRTLGWAAMVLGIVVFSGTANAPFVYFQF